MRSVSLHRWEKDGFAAAPESFKASGSEFLLRAYSPSPTAADLANQHGTSRRVNNCFFVPAQGKDFGPINSFKIERNKWKGLFLEEHLNAFVWGNAFDRIGVWLLKAGTRYNIGPIGQNTRYQTRSEPPGRHYGWPTGQSGYFRQVTLDLRCEPKEPGTDIRTVIMCVDDFAVIEPLAHRVGHT